ncbi:MAG: FAD-binding protein, partial [Desulfobulbaceae bacterium]|nr:FAD-binding protein [Desulfobulbaceae bacterium]
MINRVEITLYPEEAANPELVNKKVLQKLKITPDELKSVIPVKRSIDARSRRPVVKLICDVYINELPQPKKELYNYLPVRGDKRAVIIGFGPAGMFAALHLIELGIKPIIFERGKDVQARRRDLRGIQQFHTVNPDSNYCFGEGGAGTYSDGKLYTRSNKRGDVKKILDILIKHGAKENIAVD